MKRVFNESSAKYGGRERAVNGMGGGRQTRHRSSVERAAIRCSYAMQPATTDGEEHRYAAGPGVMRSVCTSVRKMMLANERVFRIDDLANNFTH